MPFVHYDPVFEECYYFLTFYPLSFQHTTLIDCVGRMFLPKAYQIPPGATFSLNFHQGGTIFFP